MNKYNPLVLAILILGALSFAILPTLLNVPLLNFATGVALFLVVYIVFSCGSRLADEENTLKGRKMSLSEWLKALPWFEIIVYVLAIIFAIVVVLANNNNPSHL